MELVPTFCDRMDCIFLDRTPGRVANIKGEEFLYFCGTSYLGICHNQAFKNHLIDGIELYGTNYGSSRISNIHLEIFERFEENIAKLTGAESALSVSSGFLAGQLVINYLQRSSSFFYAPHVHPALVCQQIDRNEVPFNRWISEIPEQVARAEQKSVVILSNSLDPLTVETYDFSWVEDLPVDKDIYLVIDDSHGLGVTGLNGEGVYKYINLPPHVKPVVISSLGKAFGVSGGIILSNKSFTKKLKTTPFFGGSSPISPAYLYAFLNSREHYEVSLSKLKTNISYFGSLVKSCNLFRYQSDFPVFYTSSNSLFGFLKKRKILISSFPYPSAEDPLVTRIVINSLHEKEDLDILAVLVQEYADSREY